jgi:hypothetical protein
MIEGRALQLLLYYTGALFIYISLHNQDQAFEGHNYM